MTQAIIASELIRRSMLLINAIAAGEVPADADLNDALLTLNEMIDGWNIQELAVYSEANENFVVTPGKAVYDWGVTATPFSDITSPRPVAVSNVTCVRNGFTTPVLVINQREYDSISLKSTPSPLVERFLFINSFPLAQVVLFPVPTEAVTLNIDAMRALQAPATLQTSIALPPGYLRALRYKLAVELWPEYANQTTDIAAIKKIANEAYGDIKTANMIQPVSTFEGIPNVQSGRSWDWRGGV